ncbi:MAG TPA: pilus assembly protein TadG-related protein, partial [Caulobacteraceae bacterium]
MHNFFSMRADGLKAGVKAQLARFARGNRGNVAMIVALAMAPLLGGMGMAAEGANWFLTNRAEQNAADTAVVAAANQALQDYFTNSDAWCTGSSGCQYQTEGQAVAQKYGFTNANNTTVTVSKGACPAGFTDSSGFGCFKVAIVRPVPLFLLRAIGYSGNTTVGRSRMQRISAVAYAGARQELTVSPCITALNAGPGANKKGSFYSTGGSHIDLSGCVVATNGGADCTGSSLSIPYVITGAGSSNSGCGNGTIAVPNSGNVPDPYA